MTARYLLGDTRDVLASLEPASVDLVLSSPPFFALRSYLAADDPAKGSEIGSEQTPGAFIDTLLDVAEACVRVLAPHGSLVFELGDTYASGGNGDTIRPVKASPDSDRSKSRNMGEGTVRVTGGAGHPLDKSLCLIPELFRLSLAYGRNPLTGRETDRWRVRNVVRWHRPNPPVGALGDKFRPATSDMVVACKARDRWFDLDAVREPHQHPNATHTVGNVAETRGDAGNPTKRIENHPAGAPPLDTWTIPTHPYKGSHYATWPPALCVRPILSMCPERVCTTCGQPSRRIVDVDGLHGKDFLAIGTDNERGVGLQGKRPPMPEITRTTVGWTDCGHNTWRRGIVLDPFAGTGTTLAVAEGHGRDSIGIDLDARNADLARERVGMFLDVAVPA